MLKRIHIQFVLLKQTMLKEERQGYILDEIRIKNKVHSADLSTKLDVSEDTIRRDLRELAERGALKKVHGGAMANPDLPLLIRQKKVSYKTERQKIVLKTVSLLKSGQVILLEGGVTSELLLKKIPEDFSATIFTNSLIIASRLGKFEHIQTYILGGEVVKKNQSTFGPDVISVLNDLRVDVCLLNATAIHSEFGITCKNRREATIRKAMVRASKKTIIQCLSKDIGKVQPFKIIDAVQAKYFITEIDPDCQALQSLRELGIKII